MRIFSGIQPTGEIHIGNYLGALKQWVELQEKNESIFCIVDLHSLTIPYKPAELKKNILDAVITYLAIGLDPKKSIIFTQSHVKEHAELAWLLNTVCPVSELTRMTQYKEKAEQFKKNINAGLLNYPVLMAADILLYKTERVPVGKDQVQHVELIRTIARKFNKKFGQTLIVPEVILPKMGAKIMAINDPTKKMSKSLGPKSYISLFERPEEIEKKIMTAVTDPGKEIKYLPHKKPGISNLLTIYALFSGKSIREIEKEFQGKGYGEFKRSLSDLLKTSLEPFRRRRKELSERKDYVNNVLAEGAKRARSIASQTITGVKKKMGLV